MKISLAVVFIIVIALIGGSVFFPALTTDTAQITVTGLERIVTGSGKNVSSKWIVLTETETFENTDSLFFFKFNSSDIQGKFKVGTTYIVKVYGVRIPILSSYRNIVSIESVK